VTALLTVNEYLTPMAARACAVAARNKAAMATAFEAAGVTAPRTRTVTDLSELRVAHATGALRYPCVIKPADGAGSSGVTVVTGPERLEPAWHAARTVKTMYGMPRDERVLVQGLVEGSEFSVESFTRGGSTTHLCITRKHVTGGAHRVEIGHSLPARLPAAAERALYEQAEKAIAAVGIHNGASHTELILTPDGRCTVLEIGARLGAGHIGHLLQHALGIDPWQVLWDLALDRMAPSRWRAAAAAVACDRCLLPPGHRTGSWACRGSQQARV
jgi:biotin carboxylase